MPESELQQESPNDTNATEPAESDIQNNIKGQPNRFKVGHQLKNGKKHRPILERLNDPTTRLTKLMQVKLAKHFGCAPKKSEIRKIANAKPDMAIAWDSGLRPAKLTQLEKISKQDIPKWNSFIAMVFDPQYANLDIMQIGDMIRIGREQAVLWFNEIRQSQRWKDKNETRRQLIDDTCESLLAECAFLLSAAQRGAKSVDKATDLIKIVKDFIGLYSNYYAAKSHAARADKTKGELHDPNKAVPKVELQLSKEGFDFEAEMSSVDFGGA